ncbi:histone H2A-Bbd type 1 [Marmota monax]|uniref:histone H2A-Bbd type 1 n=1 Tax=Marmota monax TaxID=9995 RepID=UPI0026E9F7E5|nr:histone H2A-Bbd type 1 [Marmota monax]
MFNMSISDPDFKRDGKKNKDKRPRPLEKSSTACGSRSHQASWLEKKYHQNYRTKKQTIYRSIRTELQFPVTHVDRLLRQDHYAQRLSFFTPVFLAGVLEYLTAKILDLAAQKAESNRRAHITPDHVKKVLEQNPQLCRLFKANTKSLGTDKAYKSRK